MSGVCEGGFCEDGVCEDGGICEFGVVSGACVDGVCCDGVVSGEDDGCCACRSGDVDGVVCALSALPEEIIPRTIASVARNERDRNFFTNPPGAEAALRGDSKSAATGSALPPAENGKCCKGEGYVSISEIGCPALRNLPSGAKEKTVVELLVQKSSWKGPASISCMGR